jgi:hypothetical protein
MFGPGAQSQDNGAWRRDTIPRSLAFIQSRVMVDYKSIAATGFATRGVNRRRAAPGCGLAIPSLRAQRLCLRIMEPMQLDSTFAVLGPDLRVTPVPVTPGVY